MILNYFDIQGFMMPLPERWGWEPGWPPFPVVPSDLTFYSFGQLVLTWKWGHEKLNREFCYVLGLDDEPYMSYRVFGDRAFPTLKVIPFIWLREMRDHLDSWGPPLLRWERGTHVFFRRRCGDLQLL